MLRLCTFVLTFGFILFIQILITQNVRILLSHPRNYIPTDDTFVAGGTEIDRDLLGCDVFLGKIIVSPVLKNCIYLTRLKSLPRYFFADVLDYNFAAKVVLENIGNYCQIRFVTHPGIVS